MVPADFLVSPGQTDVTPSQTSAASQGPVAALQIVPSGEIDEEGGQVLFDPEQKAPPAHPEFGEHWKVFGWNESVGQSMPPSHFSSASHTPSDGRQTTVVAFLESKGQAAFVPSHCSAKSQSPALGRHTVPEVFTESTGQDLEFPSQVSSLSHVPFAALHTYPLGLFMSVGHPLAAPSQNSGASHPPIEARHK